MTPAQPPVANKFYTAPESMEESQVGSIHAFESVVPSGNNLEGSPFVVTAWKPSPDELRRLNEGGPVYLTYMGGGLAPHFLSASFAEATYGLEG